MTTHIIAATAGWSGIIRAGQAIRITDLYGQQAVDTLFYALDDKGERYSSQDTLRAQGSAYVDLGTWIMSNRGRVMAVVTSNTAGPHDTTAGACSCESNTVRFGHQTRFQHACRENFLLLAAEHGMTKRDIVPNLNFFMNVPVNPNGALVIADGLGGPGSHVTLQAKIDLLCLISNCPQINNPCNGFDPSPVEVTIS